MRLSWFLVLFCFVPVFSWAQYRPYPRLETLYDRGEYTECIQKASELLGKEKDELYPYYWQIRSYLAIHLQRQHEGKKNALVRALNLALTLRKKDKTGYFVQNHPELTEQLISNGQESASELCGSNAEKSDLIFLKLQGLSKDPELVFAHYQCLQARQDSRALSVLEELVRNGFHTHLHGPQVFRQEFFASELMLRYALNGSYHKAIRLAEKTRSYCKSDSHCRYRLREHSAGLSALAGLSDGLHELNNRVAFAAALDSLYGENEDKSVLSRLRFLKAVRHLQISTGNLQNDVHASLRQYLSPFAAHAADSVQAFFLIYMQHYAGEEEAARFRGFDYWTENLRFFRRCSVRDASLSIAALLREHKLWTLASDHLRWHEKNRAADKQVQTLLKKELDAALRVAVRSGESAALSGVPPSADAGIREIQISKSLELLKKLLSEKQFHAFAVHWQKQIQLFPAHPGLMALRKQYILEDYRQQSAIESKFSGSGYYRQKPDAQSCKPGEPSPAALALVLSRLNYIRRLAGITDTVVFDQKTNRQAQAAACMMEANGQLSHYPKSTWKCYTSEGAGAASRGNLSLGHGFTDALLGQVADFGESNQACGHRRWILNPYNRVFGFGSTDQAMCLVVFGTPAHQPGKGSFRDTQFIAWPSADFFPLPLLAERWSFSLAEADFSQAVVVVTLNGKPLKVKQEKAVDGFGLNTLVWTLLHADIRAGDVCQVRISKVKISSGYRTYTYRTVFLAAG